MTATTVKYGVALMILYLLQVNLVNSPRAWALQQSPIFALPYPREIIEECDTLPNHDFLKQSVISHLLEWISLI